MTISLVAECWWTLARTVILCLFAWPLMIGIEAWIRCHSDVRQPLVIAVLITPFLFPELLMGYAYRNTALQSPQWAELLCACLLFLRIVPVGVVALLTAPAGLVSSSAIHCRWMLLQANPRSPSEWCQLLYCYLNGPVRRAMPAMGLMSIVAFQEFELAALLQTSSWTDWFIAAQRNGLDKSQLFIQTLRPVLFQLPLLVGTLVWFLWKGGLRKGQREVVPETVTWVARTIAWVYLTGALVFGCVVPLCILGRHLPDGIRLLVRQPVIWNGLGYEMLIAGLISLTAGATAWLVVHLCADTTRRGLILTLFELVLLFSGLFGSLLLSLATVAVFQQPMLRLVYDTPIPWTVALIILLLPRAFLLHLWVGSITDSESTHLARMLADRSFDAQSQAALAPRGRVAQTTRRVDALLFRLRDQPVFLAMGLLCYWAYLDLPSAHFLAPSGMQSGLVRLYDFMHFGRSAALTGQAFVFFGAPIVAYQSGVQLLRVLRWLRRSSEAQTQLDTARATHTG